MTLSSLWNRILRRKPRPAPEPPRDPNQEYIANLYKLSDALIALGEANVELANLHVKHAQILFDRIKILNGEPVEKPPPKIVGSNLVRLHEDRDWAVLDRLRQIDPVPGREYEVVLISTGMESMDGLGFLPLDPDLPTWREVTVIYGGPDDIWLVDKDVDYTEQFRVSEGTEVYELS